jgi:hypothetical protein
MQISWDHLSDLFVNHDNVNMREYWVEVHRVADIRSVLDVKSGKNENFNTALNKDLEAFVRCLPTDGRTEEVKVRLKKEYISRL